MAVKKTAQTSKEFENRLTYISRIYAFVGPMGILVIGASAEFFVDGYYSELQQKIMLPILAVLYLVILGRIIKPQITRPRLAVEYSLITVLTTLAYSCLLNFPSPYMAAGLVLTVLIYFDFGIEWAVLSLIVQYGTVIDVAIYKGLSPRDLIDVAAYIALPTAIALFVMRLLSLTREEIRSVEKNYQQAILNTSQTASLINNISDGVIAVDQNMRVFLYNAAALDVLDLNIDIRGKKLAALFKPIDAEKNTVDVHDLLKQTTSPIVNRDLSLGYKDGSYSNLFLGIAPIYEGYGKNKRNGYTILLRDITREKSLEEERDEFISVVSHELRTPIAITEGVISNAEFIAGKTGDMSAVRTSLSEAHTQVLFLADMINDLSTLSRAERGVLKVEPEQINVQELCDELLKNYSKSANDKGLELKVETAGGLGTLSSSKLYVREILQNYITNAIKYTDKGSVTISAKPADNGVDFSISDTGIGISKADQDKIFDKFFRSEDYRTRKSGGTGLGLYVTMKLMRLTHSEVRVESEIDKGSTFTVHVPNFSE